MSTSETTPATQPPVKKNGRKNGNGNGTTPAAERSWSGCGSSCRATAGRYRLTRWSSPIDRLDSYDAFGVFVKETEGKVVTDAR